MKRSRAVPGHVPLMIGLAVAMASCNPFATKGTIPPPPPGGGEVDQQHLPDYISAWNREGTAIAGYVPKACLFPEPGVVPMREEACPVFAEDLLTLVGHMVPGRGFVPLGADPADVPTFPVQVAPSAAP